MSKGSGQIHFDVEEEDNVEDSPCKCGCDNPTLDITLEVEPAACRTEDPQLQLRIRSLVSNLTLMIDHRKDMKDVLTGILHKEEKNCRTLKLFLCLLL